MSPLDIHITAQGIITAASALTALSVFIAFFVKVMRFIDRQKAQDEELKRLREAHDADIKSVKDEQSIIVYGQLACLKGLQEKGCNGPVTEAINTLEKHLNKEAHK